MFSMTIEEAMTVNNLGIVSGRCNDSLKFTRSLMDEYGNEYTAEKPLGATIAHDNTRIAIGLIDVADAKKLIGRTLKSIS